MCDSRSSASKPTDFILEMLPYFADDGDEDSSDGTLMKTGTSLSFNSTGAVQGSVSMDRHQRLFRTRIKIQIQVQRSEEKAASAM